MNCKSLIPTFFIASRSRVIPSFESFPFIQCHHVWGLAESGEDLKFFSKFSTLKSDAVLNEEQLRWRKQINVIKRNIINRIDFKSVFLIIIPHLSFMLYWYWTNTISTLKVFGNYWANVSNFLFQSSVFFCWLLTFSE